MSKKTIICFLLICWTSYLHGGTIDVGGQHPIKNIKDAIQAAFPYDTILVHEGLYHENNLLVDKPLVIIGANFPKVDGGMKHEIFTITADSVTLIGLVIQNVGVSHIKDYAGINIVKASGCVIQGNKLLNTFFGIYLQKAKDCKIIDNQITGNAAIEFSSGNAIHLWYCKNIIVKNNQVKSHRDGIYLEFVDNSLIENNLSENNLRYGLHFMFSDHDKYINNTFKNNGAGVAVMFSKFIVMVSNTFEKNWGNTSYGLLLKEIYDGEIKDNRFVENTIGIYAQGATRLLIKKNEFNRNGWAINMLGSSMDNQITHNNFVGNTFDVATNSRRNYNFYESNYWSEYNGYDLDKDGIGDVPYNPVKLFSYVVTKSEPSIILLHSLFIDIINFAEKVTPVFTPTLLTDNKPLMKPHDD